MASLNKKIEKHIKINKFLYIMNYTKNQINIHEPCNIIETTKSIKSIKSTKSTESTKSTGSSRAVKPIVDEINKVNETNKTDKTNDKKSKENHTNEIKLTKEQKIIYNDLMNFTQSPIDNEILLVGYAGTGKTTLMAKFINDLVGNKICKRIVMAAPTHKAVNIAKSKLFPDTEKDYSELEKIINIMTVHRLLNYQSYVGQEGEKFFAKGKVEPNWSIYDLVVVDECSMLSNQIIGDIKELIGKEANKKVKVIYVGDPAQLPPVNQPDSKIFNSGIRKLELDKIIRTSNQMIMELSNSHRKWIFSKKNTDIPHVGEYETTDIKLYSVDNKETKKWLDNFVRLIKSYDETNPNIKNTKKIKITQHNELDSGLEFNANKSVNENINENINKKNKINDLIGDHMRMINNHNNNIILTWTNKKSNIYNQYVRENIFNKKNLAQWEIGEILIFNDFHKINAVNDNSTNIGIDDVDGKKNKPEIISFYTSEQVKLIGIKEIKYKFEPLKFKINNNITTELNDKFRKYYKKINQLFNGETIDIYEMSVQKIIDLVENDGSEFIPEYTILSIHPKSEKKHNIIIEGIEKLIIDLKTSCYKLINHLQIDNLAKCDLQSEAEKKINKLYKEYQTNIIECFAELNYGYCITVHKSQGSTFLNVFIDMNDILSNNNINETSKCLYTSITRSSKTLSLLI